MGEVVGWAVIGGVLALFTQRRGLAVLIGTLVAVVGTVVKVAVVFVVAGAVLGAGPGRAGGLAPVARLVCLAVFAACGALAVLVVRAFVTGRVFPRGW